MWISRDDSEDIGSLPIDVKSYSPEKLASLKNECLAAVIAVVNSSSFKGNVTRVFAAGDISSINTDHFSPIVEKLLLLSTHDSNGAS